MVGLDSKPRFDFSCVYHSLVFIGGNIRDEEHKGDNILKVRFKLW